MKNSIPTHATNDLHEASAAGTPLTPSGRQSPDRRETILSLVEMLLQNSEISGQAIFKLFSTLDSDIVQGLHNFPALRMTRTFVCTAPFHVLNT
jgi:hypothetical protein